jgi:hypothetical protein
MILFLKQDYGRFDLGQSLFPLCDGRQSPSFNSALLVYYINVGNGRHQAVIRSGRIIVKLSFCLVQV